MISFFLPCSAGTVLVVVDPWAGWGAVLPGPDFVVFGYLAFGRFWQTSGPPGGLARAGKVPRIWPIRNTLLAQRRTGLSR